MDNHEFEDLGKKIQDIVDNAVNSNSYHELSHTINQTVNKAINSGSEALKNALNSVFDPGDDPEFRKKIIGDEPAVTFRNSVRKAIHTRALITEEAEKQSSRLQGNSRNCSTERLPVRISKA